MNFPGMGGGIGGAGATGIGGQAAGGMNEQEQAMVRNVSVFRFLAPF